MEFQARSLCVLCAFVRDITALLKARSSTRTEIAKALEAVLLRDSFASGQRLWMAELKGSRTKTQRHKGTPTKRSWTKSRPVRPAKAWLVLLAYEGIGSGEEVGKLFYGEEVNVLLD
jgi:hypothetical protein